MTTDLPPRTLTDEQLAAAHVTAPVELNAPVQLEPYNAAWPLRFNEEAQRLRGLLGEVIILLEHTGSTSVPGLSAKPVIDITMAVRDSADEASYVPTLQSAGYFLKIREPNWFEHRLLKPPLVESNLHVFSAGCAEIGRMLLFRNWLRSNPDDRDLYETTKRTLATRTWKYMQHYADAKGPVIAEIMRRAERAAADHQPQLR